MTTHDVAKGFSARELARYEDLLLDRRHRLLDDLQTLEKADANGAGEIPPTSSHLADLGSDREASDISLGRRESESTEIQEIDDALDRIRDGSFGLCEDCSRLISNGRLQAIPYARLCLSCKTVEEA
ncbi:MAG TPA: TraR/DksA family transcriptional regulator [Planctomycetota bacterium]|nr:TraR/DksA family transcriptional regulator [Planctomycetota bacterium]